MGKDKLGLPAGRMMQNPIFFRDRDPSLATGRARTRMKKDVQRGMREGYGDM